MINVCKNVVMDIGCHAHWRCPKQAIACQAIWFLLDLKKEKKIMPCFLAPKQPSTYCKNRKPICMAASVPSPH
jgi:hypothetical protein